MDYRVREQNELKSSGVEWLGDIPKDWDLKKLKYFAKIKNGKNQQDVLDDDGEYPIFGSGGVFGRASDYLHNKRSVLLGRKGTVDKPLYIDKPFWTVDTMYYTNIFKISNPKFFFYGCLGIPFPLYQYGSAIPSMTQEDLSNIFFAFPNLLEQQKIANFLDKKSKTFDDIISNKELLIKKLEDAKQSLISEVVTGKLKVCELDGKLQTIKREKDELIDSKVEWIGDIPKGWKVKKSKYLLEIRKRISGELGYDILSITQKGIKIKDITTGGGQLSMDYSKYQIVNVGDFAMNHMDLLTGFVDIAKSQGVTSPDYRVFTLIDKNSDADYFLYLFQMGYKNKIFYAFGQGSSQLGRWRFPTEEFKKFYFPTPSKNEQKQISIYLDEKCKTFDNTIEKTKQSIIKIKSAKESLISEAVTGKIEVL